MKMSKTFIFLVQVLLVLAIGVGTQTLDAKDIPIYFARCILYVLSLEAVAPVCQVVHRLHTSGTINIEKIATDSKNYVIVVFASLAVVAYNEQTPSHADFVIVGIAFLLVKYRTMMQPRSNINYGVGMACSYFEGYLVHTLPPDGGNFDGFEANVVKLESRQGVLFPCKKLFIIITKNMFCPPDLKDFFNKDDLPNMEAFSHLENVVKSVAGVKDRVYRHSAYKLLRPRGAPVCLLAECATPLHTLHRVLNNRTLYQQVADIDVAGVVQDFCGTLNAILDASPACRGKCELVYFDNDDPNQNLADVLLARIREHVPDFEERIISRKEDNVIEEDIKCNVKC